MCIQGYYSSLPNWLIFVVTYEFRISAVYPRQNPIILFRNSYYNYYTQCNVLIYAGNQVLTSSVSPIKIPTILCNIFWKRE